MSLPLDQVREVVDKVMKKKQVVDTERGDCTITEVRDDGEGNVKVGFVTQITRDGFLVPLDMIEEFMYL